MTMDVNQLPPDRKVDTSFLKKPIKTKNRNDTKVPFGEDQISQENPSLNQESSREKTLQKKPAQKRTVRPSVEKDELIESIMIEKVGHLNTLYYLLLSKISNDALLEASHSQIAATLRVQKKSVSRILKDLVFLKMISCYSFSSPTTSAKYQVLLHTKEDVIKWSQQKNTIDENSVEQMASFTEDLES